VSRFWNWKSAVLSVALRSPIFALAALRGGAHAAAIAGIVDAAFRLAMSGAIGALIQRLSLMRPTLPVTIVAALGVPVIAHTIEALVHWRAATLHWPDGLRVSITMSILSTLFNLYAMRHGAMIAGIGSRSLVDDVRRLPALLAGFVRRPFPF